MSHMTVETVPSCSPGACRRCGAASDRDWYLNLGYVEDFYGTVYYCNMCVREISSFVESATRVPRITELRQQLKEANDRNSNLVDLYDRLFGCGIDLFALVDFLASKEGEPTTAARTEAMGRRAAGPVEPDTDQGPIIISNDDSGNSDDYTIKF